MTSPPSPIRLGEIAIEFPLGQAALSGYSDWPMRVIAGRLGAGFTMAEVFLDQFVLSVTRGNKAARYLRVSDQEQPCGAQLMGNDPEQFGPAGLKLVAAGFDWIDLNFACPVKKVLGRHRGGYLLSQPEKALEIVGRLRDALPSRVPVTLKMRRGIDDTAQSRTQFFQIVDGAFALGAEAITVHGRTVRQRYEGRASWEFLREVKQHVGDKTVLGSGDLFTAQDCLRMMAQTGVDAVTIARGAIGNPWIFQQTRALSRGQPLPPPPTVYEQREVIAEHYRLSHETYGPMRCSRQMRKFGIKYARLHPQPDQVQHDFVAVQSPSQWRAVLDRWYAEDAPGCYPTVESTAGEEVEQLG